MKTKTFVSPIRQIVLPILIVLAVAFVGFYVMLPALNPLDPTFWAWLFMTAVIGVGAYLLLNGKEAIKNLQIKFENGRLNWQDFFTKDLSAWSKKAKAICLSVLAVILVCILVLFISSARMTNADEYQGLLQVTESDFAEDIAEIPISQIPIVDRDTAERLGSRKIGEVVELVSQFNVSSNYTQINYQGKPYRVSPLQYAGILKWLANRNEGVPYYVAIDMATQKTDLVELAEGMKYSPTELFGRDLTRHVRFAYPTLLLNEESFEIDESGHPYWVVSYFNYSIGILGGKDVQGVILVDAVTGEMEKYAVGDVPAWIDRVYSADMVLSQANDWGTLRNGYFNSILAQKNCVVTTDGYNYIAVDDDVWLYTGITSVAADESNIGFILVNMRTKEAKTYYINGAEEYSAMSSAEGKIQEKGYNATFPILINVHDRPSYFISLKDNAGLVKAYAFVSVADYQLVGVADTIEGAKAEYLRIIGVDVTPAPDTDVTTHTGKIAAIATAVVNGNSVYYIRLENGEIYTATIAVSARLPFLAVGDSITFLADKNGVIRKIED
jgi:hypothetical protein